MINQAYLVWLKIEPHQPDKKHTPQVPRCAASGYPKAYPVIKAGENVLTNLGAASFIRKHQVLSMIKRHSNNTSFKKLTEQ